MTKKKRRIIRSLTINEICAVGPAGRMVIMKRAEPWDELERRRRMQMALEELGRQLLENSRALAQNWRPLSNLLRLVDDSDGQGQDLNSLSDQFTRSPDYRSVNLHGRQFFLTPLQAHVVRILHESFLRGSPDIGQHTLLEEIESTQKRLSHVFRRSDAWGELIVRGNTKGTVRLNI